MRCLVVCALAAACGGGDGDAGGDPSTDEGAPPVECDGEPEHTGEGTYYDADGTGNCSFDATGDLMVAAMNQVDYAGSAACGSCVTVDGPDGSVTVRIVDRCPECPQGDIDMSPQAFERIAPLSAGRVPIAWRQVACDVDGPVRYRFKEGSNPFWTAIQVRNHRHAIASLEARPAGGEWRPVARESYNYFVEPDGLGDGPLGLRVTDVYGAAIVDPEIAPGDATEVAGGSQLPVCGN